MKLKCGIAIGVIVTVVATLIGLTIWANKPKGIKIEL